MIDFRLSEKSDLLRKEAREFLEEVMTPELHERIYRTGVNHDEEYAKALVARGLIAPSWPVEQGGGGRDAMEMAAWSEEVGRAAAPSYAMGTTITVASVVRACGTEKQKAELLPRALKAEIIIVLGLTEPENGSDAAAAATRAVRTGDGWTISGSKMFTTNAHIADYVFLLARTSPDKPKHQGLTCFIVPMKQPGVEVQGVRTLSGERTNITFYNDVFVSDEWRIGEVDGGWAVMSVMFVHEHSASFVGETYRLLESCKGWALETGNDSDPDVQLRIGRAEAEAEVATLLQRRSQWTASVGGNSHGQGSMSKLFSTERLERQAADLLEMIGPDGVRSYLSEGAPQEGRIEFMVRNAKGTTIYAGTSQIHRNIVSQHVLGLPRPS